MNKQTIWKNYLIVLILLFLGYYLLNPAPISAQVRTHRVIKGDTLWDICDKYYGDSDLWPKLWEMNPFVTNPHLLEPGDIITLLEGVPIKGDQGPDTGKPAVKDSKAASSDMGLNMSGILNLDTLGYLSLHKIQPWGYLFASESGRTFLSQGDTVFLETDGSRELKSGDEFTIARPSPLLKHPLTKKSLGYTLSFRGKLIIKKITGIAYKDGQFSKKKNTYSAEVIDIYNPVRTGDIIVPFQQVATCIIPVPVDKRRVENIVAAQDSRTIIGTHSIVYLAKGFKQGIRRGNIFEVVRTNIVPDLHLYEEPWYKRRPSMPPKSKTVLPDVPIGTLIVLETRPNTSTAIIVSSKEDFRVGAYLKGGYTTIETEEVLNSYMPICSNQ